MAGLMGYLAAGAAEGVGAGIVENARAKREAALEELRHSRLLERDAADREFRSAEAQKQRDFELSNRQGETITGDDGTTYVRRGTQLLPLETPSGDLLRTSTVKTRPLTEEEKTAIGLPQKNAYQIDRDGKISQIGSSGTTVNVDTGTIPAGYRAVRDDDGRILSIEPIPGSPAAAEAERASDATGKRRAGEIERGGLVTQEIDRAIDVMDSGILPDTGFGAWLSSVPNTDAKRLASRLETIRANIGFEELNKMRQQSPTGGALGQVTERELAFLQAVAGSLDQAQSAQDLRDNLNRLWNSYMEIVHGTGNFDPRPLSFERNGPEADQNADGDGWTDFGDGVRVRRID